MNKELINFMLDEYKYRHELFWKIVFRFSFAILVLYACPLFNKGTELYVKKLVLGFPIVGIFIAVGGTVLLMLEYKSLFFLERKYNECKESIEKGFSNSHATNNKCIGCFIILTWGGFFVLVGIMECLYMIR